MGIVIVTGASRGIGAAIASELAACGHTVYAGMRSPDGPHELADETGAIPLPLDVTSAGDVRHAIQRVVSERGRIDALINNAGVAWFAPAEEMSEPVLHATMGTNFFGTVRCTQAVLPVMRQAGSGKIIMISTLAAALGLPLESAYCASKSAVEAFADSLRHEVARFGIGVSVVEPGVTEGGLSTSTPDPDAPADSVYQPLLEHTFAYYERTTPESARLVTDAVKSILDGSTSEFRVRIGQSAPVIEQVLRAPDAEATEITREVLSIDWWCAGKNEAPRA